MTAGNGVELLPPNLELAQRQLALGPGLVIGSMGTTLASFPIARVAVRARVTGPIAAVEAAMSFANPYQEPLEMFYLFALPHSASVTKFKCQVGQRLLEGRVFEKEVATQQYGAVGTPAFLGNLFAREYAPVFCVKLGVCNPGENATIELAYTELLSNSGVDFQFRFPLVTSPALLAGSSLDGGDLQDAAPLVAPGLKAGPNVHISAQFEVGTIPLQCLACSQPCIVNRLQNGDVSVDLTKQGDLSARDFVVSYRYGSERAPQSYLRVGQRHFMLNIIPPWERPQNTCPRDLVILADISENTDSQRFAVQQALCRDILNSLLPGEQFSVVGFHHNIEGFRNGDFCQPAQVGEALAWLATVKPNGRADLGALFDRVLQMAPQAGRALTVLILASGKVGNEPKLYDRGAETGFQFRICTVGLDNRVNAAFLRRLASATGGASQIFSSNQPPEQISPRIVESTKYPLVTKIHWADAGCAVNPETITPSAASNLSNEPITILGMKGGDGGLALRGFTYSGSPWQENVSPSPCLNPAVSFVWAAQKVAEMIDELQLTTGPRASRLKQDCIQLCQEYRLLTELSSYVVLEPQSLNADGQPQGSILAPLNPVEWQTDSLSDLPSGGGRTRLYERRVQLVAAPEQTPTQSETKTESQELPPVKPGLIRPDEEPKLPGKLRPKSPILNLQPKHSKSPKHGAGMKGGGDKPVFKKNGEKVPSKPQLPRPGSKLKTPPPAVTPAVNDNLPPVVIEEPTRPTQVEPVVVEVPPTIEPPKVEPVVVEPVTVAPPVVQPTAEPVRVEPKIEPIAPPVDTNNVEPGVLLKQHPELRDTLMKEMRILFQAVGRANKGEVDPQIPAYLESILRKLRPMLEQSTGLKEIYQIGVLCYKAIHAKDPQCYLRTHQWVQKFAACF